MDIVALVFGEVGRCLWWCWVCSVVPGCYRLTVGIGWIVSLFVLYPRMLLPWEVSLHPLGLWQSILAGNIELLLAVQQCSWLVWLIPQIGQYIRLFPLVSFGVVVVWCGLFLPFWCLGIVWRILVGIVPRLQGHCLGWGLGHRASFLCLWSIQQLQVPS